MLGADYLRLVLSRWRLVAALVIGCTLIALLTSVLVLANDPKFEASARLNITPTSEELGYANRFVRGSTFDGGSTLLLTYAEIAHTRPIVIPVVNRFVAEQAQAAGQSEDAWIAANSVTPLFSPKRLYTVLNYGAAPIVPLREDIVDALIEHTTIETVEGTYLIRLTVEWDDPRQAAWFANALAEAVIARAEKMSSKSGTEIAGNLETRLAEKQAELAGVLKRSRDMKSAVGVVDVDRQKQSLLEAQIAEQSQLTSDRAQLQANQGQVAGLKRQTGGKMSTAQSQIDQTLALEAPKAAGLASGIAIREGRVAQIKGQIAALGKHEDTIRSLDDQATQLRTEVAALTERVSFSQTENLANAPRIQLIERATPPLTRSSPKTLLNTALGFVAGCALAGCALLLLGEAPAKREEEAEVEPVAEEPTAETPAPEPVSSPFRHRWRRTTEPTASRDFPSGIIEMPRPIAPAPAFATVGALALARDEAALTDPTPPVPTVTPDLFRGSLGQEAQAPEVVARWMPEQGSPEHSRGVRHDEIEDKGKAADETSIAVDQPAPPSRPTLSLVPESIPLEDRIFAYLIPAPRDGARYGAAEVRGIGVQVATWLGDAFDRDAPLTIAATGDDRDAQRLYQLLHDYREATGAAVTTVDWSAGAKALPRTPGKPLIYAGGGFGRSGASGHRDGAVVVAIASDAASLDGLEAEAKRLATLAGRPIHVVPLAR